MTSTGTDARSPSSPARPLTASTDPRAGGILLGLAREAIRTRGASRASTRDDPAWLDDRGAVFVTLTRDGRLRGCIGSVEARRALREDVRRNACAAAFSDARFAPLPAAEVPLIRIEVSLLSPSEALRFGSREELLAQLRPGVDGVVLRWHGHRGTFLPQVWEQLPEPAEFLEHLLHKARLPVTFWEPGVSARRFTVTAWQEGEPGAAP
ncbi:MAG: AmmeMemoRadiSam system protein A [Actinobacteria bacterium]|nr:AmmeMemoRadiSam system protein A [Actinomycetota bacterium]